MKITSGRTIVPLHTNGTIILFESWAPSEAELQQYPHVTLTSPRPWDPATVEFPTMEIHQLSRRIQSICMSDVPEGTYTRDPLMQIMAAASTMAGNPPQ